MIRNCMLTFVFVFFCMRQIYSVSVVDRALWYLLYSDQESVNSYLNKWHLSGTCIYILTYLLHIVNYLVILLNIFTTLLVSRNVLLIS